MERTCGRCGQRLALAEFHRSPRGFQAWCKSCRREYDAGYWRRTREQRLRLRRAHRRDLVVWYRKLKEGRSCADCSGIFHHAAMHWDHLPGTEKKREVSNMVLAGFRRETILEEIAKCDLVCANCHAVRTFERSAGRSSAW